MVRSTESARWMITNRGIVTREVLSIFLEAVCVFLFIYLLYSDISILLLCINFSDFCENNVRSDTGL